MRIRSGPRLASASLLLALWLLSVRSVANAADPQAPAPPPQPEQVLLAMSQYLAKQPAFGYHAEVEFDQVLPGGPKIRLAGAVDVAVSRPGQLFVDYRDDVSDRVIWFDTGRLTLLDPVASTYAQVSGPKDIDGMVAKLEKDYGMALPLGELAESDPHAVLTRGVQFAHYVGIHDVEGVYCHHVVLQRPGLDLQVFVEVGDKPVPRKLVFEYPDRVASPQFTASITEWRFERPPADRFKAKVPEGAATVEFLPVAGGSR
jgi:hypothetical protein